MATALLPCIMALSASQFGSNFLWGVATSAPQNEGAIFTDGKQASIWDSFSKKILSTADGTSTQTTPLFYYRFRDDILLAKALGFKVFRISIAWSRLFPEGTGRANKAGVQFYHHLIDAILQMDMIPMVTLYHWDLPLALEKQGGWTSYKMPRWFQKYTQFCATEYGHKVPYWLVLNEPMGFTSLGYMLGKHAPGKTGTAHFFPAVHNALLCQSLGIEILQQHTSGAQIGTTFSMSDVHAFTDDMLDVAAVKRADAWLNKLFLEPLLGKGLPLDDGGVFMEKLATHNKTWKYTNAYQAKPDFVGIQYYFPLTVKHSAFIPHINVLAVGAKKRGKPATQLGWEIYPQGLQKVVKTVWKHGSVKNIWITENGACFKDTLTKNGINDAERIAYFESHLQVMLKLKQEGVKISGYVAWTLTDNFEWAFGIKARFGLVHVDFNSLQRTIKESGYWWRKFLTS